MRKQFSKEAPKAHKPFTIYQFSDEETNKICMEWKGVRPGNVEDPGLIHSFIQYSLQLSVKTLFRAVGCKSESRDKSVTLVNLTIYPVEINKEAKKIHYVRW